MKHAGERARDNIGEPVAAIDLGTNTALLLIARFAADGRIDVIEEIARTPQLGRGGRAQAPLDPAACARTLDVLAEFAQRIDAHAVAPSRVRVVGTAALRRASDADAFARELRARTGLVLDVVSGVEEARLGQVAMNAEGFGAGWLVIDVGGGSSELACAALALRVSVPLGALVAHELHVAPAASPALGLAAVRAAARDVCTQFPSNVGAQRPVVALGGSAVSLACLELACARFDPRAADRAELATATADEWAKRLAALSLDQRRRLPLERERAEILPCGLVLLAAVLERIGAARFSVTAAGLRHGIARELASRD